MTMTDADAACTQPSDSQELIRKGRSGGMPKTIQKRGKGSMKRGRGHFEKLGEDEGDDGL